MSGKAGWVKSICISERKGERKRPVRSALLVADFGIQGDAHAGPGPRQVSILPCGSVERMRRVLPGLKDGDFAENMTVEGIRSGELAVSDRVRIGDSVILEVTQIGKECHEACAIRLKTGDCIMPREGIFCRVVSGGRVEPGDPVLVEPSGADGRRGEGQEKSPPPADASAVVLAGGRSTRFGSPKALAVWRGKKLVEHVLDVLRPIARELVLVTGPETEVEGACADVVARDDPSLPAGPLRGLVAGLRSCTRPWAWVVACDNPLVEPRLLLSLRREARPGDTAVVPLWRGRREPLVACWEVEAAARLERILRAGEHSPGGALDALGYRPFPEEKWRRLDPQGRSFYNVNTREDLAALEELVGGNEKE